MLKCFDYLCPSCKHEEYDVIRPQEEKTIECPKCKAMMERAWLSAPNSVHGDEIDVTIQHGLCHADGTPRRFRSRQELKRVAEKAGMTNYVVHEPGKGTDKSKHTQRFV